MGPYGVSYMLDVLAREVVRMMVDVGIIGGRHVLLKVKERKLNSCPPGKFNGMGSCFNRSKGCNITGFSANSNLTMKDQISRDLSVISRIVLKVFEEMSIDKKEVRGMGIVIRSWRDSCNKISKKKSTLLLLLVLTICRAGYKKEN